MNLVNKELEQTIISCMLIDENCAADVELLNDKDFTSQMHIETYKAIKELIRNNKKVDYMSVNSLNKNLPLSALIELSNTLPGIQNFEQYVSQLKDYTLKRELRIVADKIVHSKDKGDVLASKVEQAVQDIREQTMKNGDIEDTKDIAARVFEKLERISNGEMERGVQTGFYDIDRVVGGLRKGEYILLGARPSMGKTALAMNITSNILNQDKNVLFFSLEMDKDTLMERLAASIGHVDIRKERLEKKDWENIIGALGHVSSKNLFIDDDPTRTVPEMVSMARKIQRNKGLDLIVVDYLQKIPSKSGIREEMNRVNEVSNDLKNMCKLLGLPVIVISSLSRASEQREVKIPVMSDLRASGQLEFDADVVMFLHREYYYKRDQKDLKRDADLVVAKNRNGRTGLMKLGWIAEYTKFINTEQRRR